MNRLHYTATGLLLGLVVLAFGAYNVQVEDVPPSSDQPAWQHWRTVTANDTALAADTKTWTLIKGTFFKVPEGWTWLAFSFVAYGDGDGAGDPSSGHFDLVIYGCRWSSSAQRICSGQVNIGTLQLSHDPATHQALSGPTNYRYAEGPVALTDVWETACTASGATNELGTIGIGTNGLYGIWPEVTGMDTVTSVYVYVTGGH